MANDLTFEQGITPAHAGKSADSRVANYCVGDHPRACGEKLLTERSALFHTGSPPRMRGKDNAAAGDGLGSGITPAHAGKSGRFELATNYPRDHPRACGEKPSTQRWIELFGGSPPRMRGKVAKNNLISVPNGITPAHAGKRFRCRPCNIRRRDHPRACGEKLPASTAA